MRIAFYSPLKSPEHPQPSGDRRVARLLVQALSDAGHDVVLASRLRTWDAGNNQRQIRLQALGRRLAVRLANAWRTDPKRRPDLWFTYHPYHKSPDWLGPELASELNIPYVVAEASFAPKQATGPWARGHSAVATALARADAVVSLNPEDLPCVLPLLGPQAQLLELAPFIETGSTGRTTDRLGLRQQLSQRFELAPDLPWLVTVAMMRNDVKLDSFRLLAEACSRTRQQPWQLLIIGDGLARAQVEHAFVGLADKVRFLGLQSGDELASTLGACDLFVWPALGEAYGMAVLEALAAGLPALVGDRPGTRQLIRHGQSGFLVAENDPGELARGLLEALSQPHKLPAMGRQARQQIEREHSLTRAGQALDSLLRKLQNRRP